MPEMSEGPLLDRFYPIVPDAAWLRRLAPLGIRSVQIRIKDQQLDRVIREIRESVAVARDFGLQLIVNDYWREAIDAGATFVHLGQEDLAAADVGAIKAAGVRLGVSTHDDGELAAALAVAPDYVALGPVYETKLKVMKWAPQGLRKVGLWKARIGPMPLVAIGGITPERADGVIAAGADSIAVITDFMTHPSPEDRVRAWVSWSNGHSPADIPLTNSDASNRL